MMAAQISIMGLALRASIENRLCASIASRQIVGGYSTYMATCGNGHKTVGMRATSEIRETVAREQQGIAVVMWVAAVLGSVRRSISVQQPALRTSPTFGTPAVASASRGRSHPERSTSRSHFLRAPVHGVRINVELSAGLRRVSIIPQHGKGHPYSYYCRELVISRRHRCDCNPPLPNFVRLWVGGIGLCDCRSLL
jgi:hypothetical protein